MRALAGLALLLVAAPAHAFVDATQFFAHPDDPYAVLLGATADGIYFTGAPRWGGADVDCASCHDDGPGAVSLAISADVGALLVDGYTPSATYALDLQLVGETRGLEYATPTCTEPAGMPYVQCNNNGLSVEIDDEAGLAAGILCAGPPSAGRCPEPDPELDDVVVAPGGDAALSSHAHPASDPHLRLRNDQTQWRLYWIAPPAGRGSLTLYATAVDGNGGAGSALRDADPFGDDATATRLSLAELGAPQMGCSAVPHPMPGARVLLLVLSLLALVRRRGSLLLLLVFLAAGCPLNTGPLMTPGEDCAPCHHEFSVSGTVFQSPTAPTSTGLEGATVLITDADEVALSLTTNAAGNFYSSNRLRLPATVEVRIGDAVRHMQPPLDEGGCNRCHDQPPQGGAQGRVFVIPP